MLWEFNDGKERRRDSRRPSPGVHHVTASVQKLIMAKSIVKKAVEEAGRGERYDGKAERHEPRRGTQRTRIEESAFMLQR